MVERPGLALPDRISNTNRVRSYAELRPMPCRNHSQSRYAQ